MPAVIYPSQLWAQHRPEPQPVVSKRIEATTPFPHSSNGYKGSVTKSAPILRIEYMLPREIGALGVTSNTMAATKTETELTEKEKRDRAAVVSAERGEDMGKPVLNAPQGEHNFEISENRLGVLRNREEYATVMTKSRTSLIEFNMMLKGVVDDR
ncbi:hypothetical protein HC256_003907 [Beauveria bassiana]|nr:hypothetical protein HC256_003907 [Beauveria bassiana]